MFLERKNNGDGRDWQPSATIEHLRIRAQVLKTIRDFFAARGVMEVETPLMCHTSVTDPFIQSIPVLFQAHPQEQEQRYYLQTSPEYAMKRLLAANSGAIYQITKAFRQGEIGRFHNPEFTMLEWYRPQYHHHDLMDEMDELLQLILNMPAAERKSYAEVFQLFLHFDPHAASLEELAACAKQQGVVVAENVTDRDTWLQLLMSYCIEPQLGHDRPYFIYDFPASQAALARIQPGNPPVASRFEVYVQGIELANGFHELLDAKEQRKRFEHNLRERQQLGLTELLIDEYFLAALAHGLPDCAGVALGIDRLMMLVMQRQTIKEVVSFDFERV
ncbi:MAG: elongation factor P--(R)-beta-lysine ligase [Gammaproteobacteria bacterium]|nr:MAG: elongation factor P--(R)-beta-lysine ligase [Gammaproteobacteria bacterium]